MVVATPPMSRVRVFLYDMVISKLGVFHTDTAPGLDLPFADDVVDSLGDTVGMLVQA